MANVRHFWNLVELDFIIPNTILKKLQNNRLFVLTTTKRTFSLLSTFIKRIYRDKLNTEISELNKNMIALLNW